MTTSSVTDLPVDAKRSRMNFSNGRRGIVPSSICFALRQNGSFSSLKSRSIIVRLLPR